MCIDMSVFMSGRVWYLQNTFGVLFRSCSEIMRGALAERGLDLSRKLTGGGVCLRTWTGIYTGRGALATRPVSPRIPHRQVVECLDVNTLRRPGEPEASSCFALLSL